MKIATSITFFNDAVGLRASVTYSEVDDHGKVTADNKREDFVVVDPEAKSAANSCLDWAQGVINA